jgi:ankyrin repeat protein
MRYQTAMQTSKNLSSDAFIDAIEMNNLQKLKEMVNSGFDINIRLDEDGGTALMLAAMWGKLDIVKYLVEVGADVNATAVSDFALSCAAIEGHYIL